MALLILKEEFASEVLKLDLDEKMSSQIITFMASSPIQRNFYLSLERRIEIVNTLAENGKNYDIYESVRNAMLPGKKLRWKFVRYKLVKTEVDMDENG